jgi:hypothetical protein
MLAATPGQPQSLRGALSLHAFLKWQKAAAGSTAAADQRNLVRRAWAAAAAAEDRGHPLNGGTPSVAGNNAGAVAAAAEEGDVFGRLFLGRSRRPSAVAPLLAFAGFVRLLELLEDAANQSDSDAHCAGSGFVDQKRAPKAGASAGVDPDAGSVVETTAADYETAAAAAATAAPPSHGGFSEVTDDESGSDLDNNAQHGRDQPIPRQGFLVVESADSQPPPLSSSSLLLPRKANAPAKGHHARVSNDDDDENDENDEDVFAKLFMGKQAKVPKTEADRAAARAAAPMPPGATKVPVPQRLHVGDPVSWKGEDGDVPRGSVGVVECVHVDGDVEVSFANPRFYGGYGGFTEADGSSGRVCFTFSAERLQLEGQEPATALGAFLSGLLD